MPGSGDGYYASTAERLDRELPHLARLEGQVDRELGKGLALLWDREHYQPLGYVRATDFVREMLGIQEGRARWLAKLGRYVAALPELDRAMAQDRICASQAIELGTILGPQSSAEERADWIARAQRLGVRELRRAIRAEKQRRAEEAAPDGTSAPASETNDPDAPAGGWMTIPAPARVGAVWEEAVEMARKSAGQHLSQGQAYELMCAEYLSALGPESASRVQTASQPANGAQSDAARERLIAQVVAALNRQSDELARAVGNECKLGIPKEILRAAMLANESARAIPREQPPTIPELPSDCRVSEQQDPWELADVLRRLIGLKRNLRHELAGRLSTLMHEVNPLQLGFPTLEAYCVERLGFGIGRAERLVRFQSGLAKFPLLAAAYLDGRISYTAALLLLPILHRSTEAVWVAWADGTTYREVERVVEHARTFALPEANPVVLEGFLRELEAQGLARWPPIASGESSAFSPESSAFSPESSAFSPAGSATAVDESQVPPGCALPPEPGGSPGGLSRIAGFPRNLLLAESEFCVAQIRFWMPSDALELAHRALDRCRFSMPDPCLPMWTYFEVILVHFLRTHDTPEAQKIERRHQILARDHFRCVVSGCMSRRNLNSHHLEYEGRQGTDHDWNQAGACFGHHVPGEHAGVIQIGGFAPDQLVFRLGIHPKTGKALVCYRNERRVSEEEAAADLARWRQFWRAWHAHVERRGALEAMRAPMAAMKPSESAVLQLA